MVPTLRFEEDESLPVKKRKEKQGANQGHGVGGSPGHRRTQSKVVLDGAESKGDAAR